MTPDRAEIFGGVDTHKQVHVAAALDAAGRLLATAEFDAAPTAIASWVPETRPWRPASRSLTARTARRDGAAAKPTPCRDAGRC